MNYIKTFDFNTAKTEYLTDNQIKYKINSKRIQVGKF